MEIVYLICFLLLGLVMGSFFCVVGLRLGREENFITGRSYCDSCHHELVTKDLVPLFSYIFLKGRCRYCKNKINPLSFFIELFTGILFMIAFYSFSFSIDLLIVLVAISLTMIIFASDSTYLIIPDEVLAFFAVIFIILDIFKVGFAGSLKMIGGAVFLFLVMYALMKFGDFLLKKESLGGGDVKLLFVIGLVLEPLLGIVNIFLGSFIALPVSVFLYKKNKEHVIPFGPFLLVAFLIILFSKITQSDIINLILNLN